MTATSFEYWRPGEEERQLRVFISYRYGRDQTLYDGVITALNSNGFPVQDVSLAASQILSGPRGGELPTLEVQSEIAARIYTSDVLIAPSRPATTRSRWVTWEVQLAAIGYGIPILFVNQRNNQQRRTKLVAEVEDLGLPHRACNPVASEIARNVAELVNPRPDWAVRKEETEPTIRFRGPPSAALNDVLRKLPFRPRLASPELPAPPSRRPFWSLFSHRHHAS